MADDRPAASADDCTVQVLNCTINSQCSKIFKMTAWSPCAGFVNSTGKSNSLVMKTLKPVLSLSRDLDPLKEVLKKIPEV
jgi:hypothetical protein